MLKSDGEEIRDEVVLQHTSTMTKRQARAVLKRVNTLKSKLKKQSSVNSTDVIKP